VTIAILLSFAGAFFARAHGREHSRGITGCCDNGGTPMNARIALCLALTLAALPARADEETKVRAPDGQNLTVRTDESGTTVSKDAPGAVPATTQLEQQHREAVKEVTKSGGEVLEERNVQR
jgi:hypothetical protein